jgi:hypothetical protein
MKEKKRQAPAQQARDGREASELSPAMRKLILRFLEPSSKESTRKWDPGAFAHH